jgi:hypothetical protein
VAELGALAQVDDGGGVVVQVDFHGGVGGVDAVLKRPGGLLGEADLGVAVTRLRLGEQVGDGEGVGGHGHSSIRAAGIVLG